VKDPFAYRDMYLALGAVGVGIASLIACISGASPGSPCVITGVLVLVFAGVAFSYELRRMAYRILPGPWRPWYARPWGDALLWISLFGFSVLWTIVDVYMVAGSPFDNVVPYWSRNLLLIGVVLITVPCFDYPQGRRQPRPGAVLRNLSRRSRHGTPTFRRIPRTPARKTVYPTALDLAP
jgi:hypothetical protein